MGKVNYRRSRKFDESDFFESECRFVSPSEQTKWKDGGCDDDTTTLTVTTSGPSYGNGTLTIEPRVERGDLRQEVLFRSNRKKSLHSV